MRKYIHNLPDWPRFHYSQERLAERLAAVRHEQGRLLGHMEALGFPLQREAELWTLTEDVVKSSEIEGEHMDAEQVRSSIARRLGLDAGGLRPADRNIEGVVDMLLDATGQYQLPLTADRLFGWHASLFPAGRSGLARIRVGEWRDDASGPMQVISGPVGRERVHFQAPAAGRIGVEIETFLQWFAGDAPMDGVMKAALAHLWFVTIHPFDDGNGRMARAIADMALARCEGSPQRFYSMAGQIRLERAAYYDVLEATQKGSMDVTVWMEWFIECMGRAIAGAHVSLGAIRRKARFWQRAESASLNDRQRLMVNRLLDGFNGKLTTSKWAALTKCSQDTALRDVLQLVEQGVLVRQTAGGRSTHYALAE